MAIKVKNINGTGSNARNISGSWLNYWESKTGRTATQCMAYDEKSAEDDTVYRCNNTENLVGGHVMKVNSVDKKWYILPICASHNTADREFWAREEDLVPASED